MSPQFHVGPYRVIRLINRGGQGSVYLGFDDRLNRRVAIKLMPLPADKEMRREVLREARVVAELQSSKIVQIYDLIVARDHVALIMEYVPGCDLEELLSDRGLCMGSILTICIEVAGALAIARQSQIVHGDIKASNILITDRGTTKLSDFGIARLEGHKAANRSLAGSVSCISPEQYRGEALDVRSDLFSLGCLMYRLLSGRHPFVTGGELNVGLLLEGMPEPLENIVPQALGAPRAMYELVLSLLQKSPDDRPNNTHQVRSALRMVLRSVALPVENTLLNESSASFRRESPEDVPLDIPSDLFKNSRSGLLPPGIKSWLDIAILRIGHGGVGGLVLVFALLVAMLSQYESVVPVFVQIEVPQLALQEATDLPAGLSEDWLVNLLKQSMAEKFEQTFFVGPTGKPRTTAVYSQDLKRQPDPDEIHILSSLICENDICLLRLELQNGYVRATAQELLFTHMPISQWADAVMNLAETLLLRAPGVPVSAVPANGS
jgi:serine/threonine protein kinase